MTQIIGAREGLSGRELVTSRGPIFEAFPNAFLAVLLPEEVFASATKPKRGKKFDWLYASAFSDEIVVTTLSAKLQLPDSLWRQLRKQDNHDLRAALLCLLTAAFAACGTGHKIGDEKGGWFWLPPLSIWQDWAREGLTTAERKMVEFH